MSEIIEIKDKEDRSLYNYIMNHEAVVFQLKKLEELLNF